MAGKDGNARVRRDARLPHRVDDVAAQNAADGARAFVPKTGEFSRSQPQWTLAMSNGR